MWICVVGTVLGASVTVWADPLGTAFLYQGRLTDQGNPANGAYDFNFTLHDSSGAVVGGPYFQNEISVTDGYFTVSLDFETIFQGQALWLEIEIKPSGPGGYTNLSPWQPIRPAPYALYLYALDGAGDGGGFWADSSNDIYNTNSGNVGIGTQTPSESLELGQGNLLVRGEGGFSITGDQGIVYLGDNNHYIKAERDFGLKIGTYQANDVLTIRQNNGYVGIGTTDPQVRLDVAGRINGYNPVGDGKLINTAAIGAQVRIQLKDQILTRQIEAGTGEGNQNDLILHFGLADYNKPVSLEITWPNRKTIEKPDLKVNQLFKVYYN